MFLLLLGNISYPKAREEFSWSEQERIPDYYQLAQEPPYLVADQNNTVHAFNSQPLALDDDTSPKAAYYRQWTEKGGWSYPNDILYDSAGGSIEVLDVASDHLGRVYLIFQKDFGDVYFTSADLANAGNSNAWSYPTLLARESRPVSIGFEGIGRIAVTKSGTIVVVYSGSEYGNGLYSVYSPDYGDTWSSPYPVYLTGDETVVVTDPALFVGSSGKLHAVWSTFENDGSGGPGYYAAYDPEQQTWAELVELDVPGIRTPSVIEYQNRIFVSYYHRRTNGNWWRYSTDGGETWSDPGQLSPKHVGTNGRVSFVVDSADTLHGLFGERINDLNHGLWEIIWKDGFWSDPAAIVRGPAVRDVVGGNGFDPRSARAVVSNGNTLLVTWTTDGFAGVNGSWFSYETLNAPLLPSVTNPVPTANFDTSSVPTGTANLPTATEVQSTPPLVIDPLKEPSTNRFDPQTSILAGATLAAIVLVSVVILKLRSQAGR